MRYGIIYLLMLFMLGCASTTTRKEISAGHIGCPKDEIKISDENVGWRSTSSWRASCRGHQFYCSSISGGHESVPRVSCKEELKK